MGHENPELYDGQGNPRYYKRESPLDGWWGETWSAAPTQGRGAIQGFEWYFRARSGTWHFVIAVPPLTAVDTALKRPPSAFVLTGDGEPLPWDAWQLIESCLATYRRRQDPS
jgi:hypothetical protein